MLAVSDTELMEAICPTQHILGLFSGIVYSAEIIINKFEGSPGGSSTLGDITVTVCEALNCNSQEQ